jgi:hypothetical protein
MTIRFCTLSILQYKGSSTEHAEAGVNQALPLGSFIIIFNCLASLA